MNDLATLKVTVPEGELGGWRVERFTVKDKDMGALHYALHGRPVPTGTYTRLIRAGSHDPMMSDTPAEMRDHLGMLSRLRQPTTRRVLLNGLGLGMAVGWALGQEHVEHVDVVEIDQAVVDLIGPHYERMAEAQGKTLGLHCADALTVVWPANTRWDVVWSDIWPYICSDNLPDIHRLRRRYARRAGWHGCWCEHECKRLGRGWMF